MSVALSLRQELDDADVVLATKALRRPVRVRVLRLLLAEDSCFCGEIVLELPLGLLHRNILRFGTITNTIAAACELSGAIHAEPPVAVGKEHDQ